VIAAAGLAAPDNFRTGFAALLGRWICWSGWRNVLARPRVSRL